MKVDTVLGEKSNPMSTRGVIQARSKKKANKIKLILNQFNLFQTVT